MKIAPQLLHLARLIHHCDDLSRIPRLALLAPVAAFDDFVVGEVGLVGEVVSDPFVEVEAPVGEGVGHCCADFAGSITISFDILGGLGQVLEEQQERVEKV